MSKDKKNNKNNFYITTPIYYTSGKPHLGHAYTSIACDVLARWNRNIGKNVFFSTGTDEHGQKVEQNARAAGVEPKEFVDNLIPAFKEQLEKLNISNDYFVRTTDEHHKKFVQDMLQKSFDNGDIYKAKYEGLYCIDCEQYYKEEDLMDDNICPIHKKKVSKMSEENYFFRLSKYEDKLLKLYEDNPDFLSPHSKAKETINRVKEGLQDISISRNKESLQWGIELPFDNTQVAYVWFDALFNYVSLLDKNDKNEFWPASVHVVGKDIMWFHKVYWPAFLMSTGYEMPKKVFAHGWWTVDSEKMGKALDNVIDPIKVAQKYGVDEFRYYMLALGAFGDDLDFSYETFAEKINNELNNDLGNLISRVHAMTNKYFGGNVPNQENLSQHEIDLVEQLNIFKPFNEAMQNLEFNKAINILWKAIRETNVYVNKVAPWKEEDMKRLSAIMNTLNFAMKTFADYIDCFMPSKAQRIRKQYNFEKGSFDKFEAIPAGHTLGEKDNLFEKIKLEKKEEPKEEVREGFRKLNLKAAQIVKVELHPDSEKLFVLQVDLGSEKRQIVSGLQGIYKKEELENKKVIVIANLKAAKLGGYESQGMILACEDPEIGHDDCGLLTTTLKVGAQISCGKDVADNDAQIKSKIFQKTEMFGKSGKVLYNDTELKGVGIDRDFKGKIC
ncbi:MAG: methionine--tRNA ligase [Candidatus Woesearchaeota archaeon]|jgi:methionyl-tRNA synthetase|nr:methionine--tRNA ligase [Candidatus Woesearchaeota archaeon]